MPDNPLDQLAQLPDGAEVPPSLLSSLAPSTPAAPAASNLQTSLTPEQLAKLPDGAEVPLVPDSLRQLIDSNPSFPITREHAAILYNDDKAKSFGDKAGAFASAIPGGLEGLWNQFLEAHNELKDVPFEPGTDRFDQENKRIGATLLHSAKVGGWNTIGTAQRAGLNFWDWIKERATGADDNARIDNYLHELQLKQDVAKREANLSSPEYLKEHYGDTPPYLKAAQAASLFTDPAFLAGAGGVKLAGAGLKAGLKTTAAGEKVLALAEKAKALPGKVLEAGGETLEKAAKFPVQYLTDKLSNILPEGAEKLAHIGGAGSVLAEATGHGSPFLWPLAALKKAEWAGRLLKNTAGFYNRLAQTAGDSVVPRLVQMARDPSTPNWMKLAAGQMDALGVGTAAQFGKDLAEGAVHGGAVGSGLSLAAGDRPEEAGHAAGAGIGLGAAGRVTAKVAGADARARRMLATIGARQRLVEYLTKAGMPLEKIGMVDDATAAIAGHALDIFGDRLKIKFEEPGTVGPGGEGAAWFDEDGIVHIRLGDKSGRIMHELPHAILRAAGAPGEARILIDSAFSPQQIEQFKMQYAAALAKSNDPGIIAQKVNELDTKHGGDKWIYDELYAEAGYGGLVAASIKSGHHGIQDILGVNRTPLQKLGTMARGGFLNTVGDFFDENGKPAVPVNAIFSDPEIYHNKDLRKMVYDHLRKIAKMDSAAPKKDDAAGVVIPKNLVGKHPAAPAQPLVENGLFVQNAKGELQPSPKIAARLDREKAKQVAAQVASMPVLAKGDANPEVSPRIANTGEKEVTGSKIVGLLAKLPGYGEFARKIAATAESFMGTGNAMRVWYFPVGTSEGGNWRRSVGRNAGDLPAKQIDFAPFEFRIDGKNHVLVTGLSVTAADRKIARWQQEGRFGAHWNTPEEFRSDLLAYLKNHAEGRPGAEGLDDNKRNLLNLFVVGKQATLADLNPLRAAARGEDRQGIIRSLRLDRISSQEPSPHTGWQAEYPKKKLNLSPEVGNTGKAMADLIALHNTSIEGLIHADKIGGLAMPSFAILNRQHPFTSFGDVTLVGHRHLVDPATGAARVFDSDAYSARQVRPEYRPVKTTAAQAFVDRFKPAYKSTDELHRLDNIWDHMVNKPDPEHMIRDMLDDYGAKLEFLREKGLPLPEIVREPYPMRYSFVRDPRTQKFLDDHPDFQNTSYGSPEHLEFSELARKIWHEELTKQHGPEFANLNDGEFDNVTGLIKYSAAHWAGDDYRNLKEGKTRIDRTPTEANLKAAFTPELKHEFDDWVKHLVESIFPEPHMTLGRRKVPYTIANILAAMSKKAPRGAEEGITYGPARARANAAREFKTIDDLHTDTDRLVSSKEFRKFVNDVQDPILKEYREAITDEAARKQEDFGGVWDTLDEAHKVLADYLRGGKKDSPERMARALARWKFRESANDPDTVALAIKAANLLRHAPTEYFEAKAQRGITLPALAGIVLKKDQLPKAQAVIDKHKLAFETYEGEQDRQAAVDRLIQKAQATGKPVVFSPEVPNKAPVPEQKEPAVFYSQLERVVNAKMPARAAVGHVKNILSPQNGVKPDEVKWTGIDDWLAKQKGSVTKDEVLNFIRANNLGVRLKEVVNGGGKSEWSYYGDWDDLTYAFDDYDYVGELAASSENDSRALVTLFKKGDEIYLADEHGNAIPRYNFSQIPKDGFKTLEEAKEAGKAIAQEIFDEREKLDNPDGTKFSEYQLPGGENYSELLFTLTPAPDTRRDEIMADMYPNRKYGGLTPFESRQVDAYMKQDHGVEAPVFDNSHWKEANVLAHVRFNERKDAEGKPVLFLEEIQSDWHEQGRKHGYTQPGVTELDSSGRAKQSAPDAPFKKTWHELVFRRMVRWAADNGFDRVAWTTGEQQASRYSLEHHFDEVRYDYDQIRGTYDIRGIKDGHTAVSKQGVTAEDLPDVVGRDIANKMIASEVPSGQFTGLDLKVGGEGMRGFYDKMIVDYANKLGKKFGARVEQIEIPTDTKVFTEKDKIIEKVHSLPITPEMKAHVQGGQPLFSPEVKQQSPIYYSQLEKVVDEKMPARAAVGHLKNIIDPAKNSGVKADEVKWSGLNEWLEQQKGSVQKADVLKFLADNRTEIKDVRPSEARLDFHEEADSVGMEPDAEYIKETARDVYFDGIKEELEAERKAGDNDYSDRELEDKAMEKALDQAWQSETERTDWAKWTDQEAGYTIDGNGLDTRTHKEFNVYDPHNEHIATEKDWDDAVKAAREHAAKQGLGEPVTKYENYTLPGGKNYGELLLTWPGPKGVKTIDATGWKAEPYGTHDPESAAVKKWFVTHSDGADVRRGTLFVGGTAETAIAAAKADLEASLNKKHKFQSGHWDPDNVIAHIRHDDRSDLEGKKVFLVEEIQSDWHEQGRDHGYRTPETEAEKKRLIAIAEAAYARSEEARKEQRALDDRFWKAYRPLIIREMIKDRGFSTEGNTRASVIAGQTRESINARIKAEGYIPHENLYVAAQYLHSDAKPGTRGRGLYEPIEGRKRSQIEDMFRYLNDSRQLEEESRAAHDRQNSLHARAVEDAPFKKTWHELAFKRALRLAADQGYDRMAWTTGQQNADRYNLADKVSSISYNPESKYFAAQRPGESWDAVKQPDTSPQKLVELIGKDAADRLLKMPRDENGNHVLKGDDLEVGGAGMKFFYDGVLVKYAQKLAKQFNSVVHDITIIPEAAKNIMRHMGVQDTFEYKKQLEKATHVVHAIDITPEMRAGVQQGQPLFSPEMKDRVFYRGTEPGETRRIQSPFAHGKLFISANRDRARDYGSSIEEVHAKPDAKILKEGTPEFRKVVGVSDVLLGLRKNEKFPAGLQRAVDRAEQAGYDAVMFKQQGDVGTVVLNEEAFIRNVGAETENKSPVKDEGWPEGFPNLIQQTTIQRMKSHPQYTAAKAGDVDAAGSVAADLVRADKFADLHKRYPNVIMVPVHAEEASGRNKLPVAYAAALERLLPGWKMSLDIVQNARAHHTGADAISRLLRVPTFDGPIEPGSNYLLVDDVVTSGSTLAALRRYITERGGKVVGAASYGSSGSMQTGPGTILAPLPASIEALKRRFDIPQLERLLSDYGIAEKVGQLTNSQARYLASFRSLESLRDRIIAAGFTPVR